MSSRREFLACVFAAGGVVTLGATRAGAPAAPFAASKPLRLLILGGTGNIGPYHVRAAVARGHQVSVFSRGRSAAELPPGVKHLVGDRNGDLKSIRGGDWDAVIDVATFGPRWVRTLGETLRGRVGHYTFISTTSVYDNPVANKITDETSPVLAYHGSTDPYSVTAEGPDYGALKVLCEREAEKQFPGRTLVVRPASIAGPNDTHPYISFWLLRMQRGGEVLAIGDRSTPVQFIDVRDQAKWIVRMAEKRGTGIYNVTGPVPPTDLEGLINAARETAPVSARVTWVTREWLSNQEDNALFNGLLFWEDNKGSLTGISNSRALRQGLTTRSVGVTMADEWRWLRQQPPETAVFLGFRRKPDGSGFERATVPWPVYFAREQALLTAWHSARGKVS
jgi:2'-hydroxyisoflavone reductase